MILKHQPGALAGEHAGNRRPNAAGSARDDDNLAAKIRIHG